MHIQYYIFSSLYSVVSPVYSRLYSVHYNPKCVLCVQESISDFYWYYSGKDVIDEHGQCNFSKAISVAKQVFNTLTEYIQVRNTLLFEEVGLPCVAFFIYEIFFS